MAGAQSPDSAWAPRTAAFAMGATAASSATLPPPPPQQQPLPPRAWAAAQPARTSAAAGQAGTRGAAAGEWALRAVIKSVTHENADTGFKILRAKVGRGEECIWVVASALVCKCCPSPSPTPSSTHLQPQPPSLQASQLEEMSPDGTLLPASLPDPSPSSGPAGRRSRKRRTSSSSAAGGASPSVVTLVGMLPGVSVGSHLQVWGSWETHATFGQQLR